MNRHGYPPTRLSVAGVRSWVRLYDRDTLWVTLKGGRASEPAVTTSSLSSNLGICSPSCDFLLSCIAAGLRLHKKVSERALSSNGLLYQVVKTTCGFSHMTLYEFSHLPSHHFVYDQVLDRLVEVNDFNELLRMIFQSGATMKSFYIQSASMVYRHASVPGVIPYSGVGYIVGRCASDQHSEITFRLFTEKRIQQAVRSNGGISLNVETQSITTDYNTYVSTKTSKQLCVPPCLYVGSKDDPR